MRSWRRDFKKWVLKSKMKFIVESYTMSGGESLLRAYNDIQMPDIGKEYTTDKDGYVIGKCARITHDEEDGYTWHPCATSYTSYYFKSTPIKICIRNT